MDKKLLLGLGHLTLPIPPAIWKRTAGDNLGDDPTAFMTDNHRRVHHYCVVELCRQGIPLTPDRIAAGLDLSLGLVVNILDDLEQHKTFLFRGGQKGPAGAVTWAYPVTVDQTPHRVHLSSGEQTYAA
jgi:hypothetical protein